MRAYPYHMHINDFTYAFCRQRHYPLDGQKYRLRIQHLVACGVTLYDAAVHWQAYDFSPSLPVAMHRMQPLSPEVSEHRPMETYEYLRQVGVDEKGDGGWDSHAARQNLGFFMGESESGIPLALPEEWGFEPLRLRTVRTAEWLHWLDPESLRIALSQAEVDPYTVNFMQQRGFRVEAMNREAVQRSLTIRTDIGIKGAEALWVRLMPPEDARRFAKQLKGVAKALPLVREDCTEEEMVDSLRALCKIANPKDLLSYIGRPIKLEEFEKVRSKQIAKVVYYMPKWALSDIYERGAVGKMQGRFLSTMNDPALYRYATLAFDKPDEPVSKRYEFDYDPHLSSESRLDAHGRRFHLKWLEARKVYDDAMMEVGGSPADLEKALEEDKRLRLGQGEPTRFPDVWSLFKTMPK